MQERASRTCKGFGTLALGLGLGATLVGSGCATTKKATPELSRMEGKRVAVVSIEGEPTARAISEVALVNQLIERGTFIVVGKREVEKARVDYDLSPLDWKGLAQRVKADFALRAKVLQFDAPTREGYNKVEIEDSQLAEDRGDDGKSSRYVKVKSLEGVVRIDLEFTQLGTGETREAVAEARETVTADESKGSAHLPPKLRFLEKLANKAFRDFFDQYN